MKHAETALRPGGILLAYLPTILQVVAPARGARRLGVRHGRDARGAPAHLARRRPVGPPRPPHGRAHRLPHPRALPASRRGRELPRPRRPRDRRRRRLGRVPARVRAPGHVVGRPRGSASSSRVLFVPDVADALARLAAAHPAPGVARVRHPGRARRAGRRRRGRQLRSRPRSRDGGPGSHQGDRVAGAVVGAAGVLVFMWLLIPALASSPGWTARAVRDSAVARAIDRRRARTAVGVASPRAGWSATRRSPRCSTPSRRPTPGTPPADGIPADAADARHARRPCWSRARRATASRRAPASSPATTSSSPTRTSSRARAAPTSSPPTAAGSTPRRRVRSRTATSRCCACPGSRCPRSPSGEGRVDDRGALFGHPGGRSVAPGAGAHRRADRRPRHRHLPHHAHRREVFVLAAVTAPGDSGGAGRRPRRAVSSA